MGVGRVLRASLAAVLGRPRWWLIALAGYLVRGGLLLFLVPIVVLPTPAGLANAVAPTLVGFVFGSPSDAFVQLVVAATAALGAWLLLGGLAAAWLEVALAREVLGEAGEGDEARHCSGLGPAALGIRLASSLPFAVAVGWGAVRLVSAVYGEIIAPGDVTVPIVVRVIAQIPEVIAVLLLTWLAGETAGGLAVRELVVAADAGERRSAWSALVRGWARLARPASLATLLALTLAVAAVAVPSVVAAAFAWGRVRTALADGAPWPVVAWILGSFSATWLAGLALVAVAVTWRAVAWTMLVADRVRHAAPPRTL